MIGDVFTWLNDPAHYRTTRSFTGITDQIITHLQYSGIAMAIALLIALPIGLFVGHTGRGNWLISGANAVRAIPGIGLLVLLAVMISPNFVGRTNLGFLIPTEIVLVVIAVPAILSNTAAGLQNVEPAIRDAARGMGMTGSQVLWRVELPNSLPLIFSGVRSATLQVIATATIAAYLPLLGGLGRFIYDGLRQQDFPQMVSGGLLVAILAVVIDLVLAIIQRLVVSPGVSRRFSKKRRTAGGAADSVLARVEPDDAPGAIPAAERVNA